MSQTNSPRGVLNSPRTGSDHDKALSRDISLAVAAILEESKTYKDLDEIDTARKYVDTPQVLNDLFQKESLESSITSSKGDSETSQKLKKLKKKIIKKVKGSVSKLPLIGSTDSKSQITERPPSGLLKSALAPMLTMTSNNSKKLSAAANPKKASLTLNIKTKTSIAKVKKPKTTTTDAHGKKRKRIDTATDLESTSTLSSKPSKLETTLAEEDGKSKETTGDSQSSQKREEKRTTPVPPALKDYGSMEVVQFVASVQKYLDHLGYERKGEPKIRVNTKLSVKQLMGTAKQLIKAGEQIKCLHALVMGVHFTNNCNIVERFPIHFRSHVNGKTYKHVTLGIYLMGNYGALGISRDAGLQDKPPIYPRLSDMINDYFRHYTDAGHELKEVQIGNIICHNPHSLEPITWKLAKIDMQTMKLSYETEIEKCSRKLRSQMGAACLKSTHMDPYEYIEHTTSTRMLNSRSSMLKSKSLSVAVMKNRSIATAKAISMSRTKPAIVLPTQKSRKALVKPKLN